MPTKVEECDPVDKVDVRCQLARESCRGLRVVFNKTIKHCVPRRCLDVNLNYHQINTL